MGTLAIASLSSIAAALFIHKFWTGGAILGAGITPIIVAVVSESLKRPQQKLAARRAPRAEQRPSAMRGAPDLMPVEPEPEPVRDDRFGIWDDQRPGRDRFHWVRGRALKVALATGAAAFVVGAFLLTGAELVLGGGGGDGGDRLRLVPGKQEQRDTDRDTETTTAPADETETVPEEETPAVPETTPETVPTLPETTPPGEAPSPETTPAPETPVPPTTPAEPAPTG